MSDVTTHRAAEQDRSHPGASVTRNAFFLLAGQVVTTALAIVLNAALGRYLGNVDFGIFYLVLTTGGLVFTVVEWGQQQYLVREVAQRPARSGEILGTALLFRLVVVVLASGAALIVARLLGYDGRTRLYTALYLACFLPFSLAQAFGTVFRGHERMEVDASLYVIAKALGLALSLPALAAGWGLPAVIVAQGVAGVMALGVAGLVRRRQRLPALALSRAEGRALVVGGAPLVSMNIIIAVQGYVEAVLLSKLATAAAVGWYGAARTFMNALITPAAIVSTAEFPRLSRAAADMSTFRAEVRGAMRPYLGLAALGSAGTYLFADLAVRLVFGAQAFAPATAILQLYTVLLFLYFASMMLGNVALAAGRAVHIAGLKLGAVCAGVAFDWLLIPWCQARYGNGGIGVVLAGIGSELVMLVGLFRWMPRGVIEARIFVDLGRSLLAGGATVLAVRLLPVASPLLTLPLCLVAFAVAAAAVGLLRRSDLDALRAALRRRQKIAAATAAATPAPGEGTGATIHGR